MLYKSYANLITMETCEPKRFLEIKAMRVDEKHPNNVKIDNADGVNSCCRSHDTGFYCQARFKQQDGSSAPEEEPTAAEHIGDGGRPEQQGPPDQVPLAAFHISLWKSGLTLPLPPSPHYGFYENI